jgi:hypothetical protein
MFLPSLLVFELKIIILGIKFKGNFLTKIVQALHLAVTKILKHFAKEPSLPSYTVSGGHIDLPTGTNAF